MTDPLAPLRALPRLRLARVANILDNPLLQVRSWPQSEPAIAGVVRVESDVAARRVTYMD